MICNASKYSLRESDNNSLIEQYYTLANNISCYLFVMEINFPVESSKNTNLLIRY